MSSRPPAPIDTVNSPGLRTRTEICSTRRPSSDASASLTSRADSVAARPRGSRRRSETVAGLGFRPVERADAAVDEAELEQLLGRLGIARVELAVVDGRDHVGERAPAALVEDHREHGLRLGAEDLGDLASDGNRQVLSLSSEFSSCSRPPLSTEQWMPHSFGAPDSHHQRPSREASPGLIARVHGAQPIDV